MKNKKVKRVVIILVIIAILCVPLPMGSYDDGGTREYAAFAYRIVVWNRLYNKASEDGSHVDNGVYHKTSVYWFPFNWLSYDALWDREIEPELFLGH